MTTTAVGSRLTARILAVDSIDRLERQAMHHLLASHFAGTDRATFDADLEEKNCAILLEDETGALRGFSTLLHYQTCVAGSPTDVIYSGDTIVERGWRNSSMLPRAWIRAVRSLVPETETPLYWFLLTSGYRTYRFLPVFFRSFYPKHDDPEDASAALLEMIARERFGDRYDPESGIVRLAKPQVLMADVTELPSGRTVDPHVAFFLARNPGHRRGDELACLTRIHDDNFTPAALRMTRGTSPRQRPGIVLPVDEPAPVAPGCGPS
jgi:hypothetical protein